MDGQVDFIIGHFSITALRNKYLTQTDAYSFTPWILIIPQGSYYSSLEKLFGPFEFKVWLLMLFIFIVAFIIISIIQDTCRYKIRHVLGLTSRTPHLNVLLVTVGGPLHALPTKSFCRCLLTIFILYNMILRNAYQGSLIQKMQSEDRKPPLASVAQMINENFVFYLRESLVEHIEHMSFKNR